MNNNSAEDTAIQDATTALFSNVGTLSEKRRQAEQLTKLPGLNFYQTSVPWRITLPQNHIVGQSENGLPRMFFRQTMQTALGSGPEPRMIAEVAAGDQNLKACSLAFKALVVMDRTAWQANKNLLPYAQDVALVTALTAPAGSDLEKFAATNWATEVERDSGYRELKYRQVAKIAPPDSALYKTSNNGFAAILDRGDLASRHRDYLDVVKVDYISPHFQQDCLSRFVRSVEALPDSGMRVLEYSRAKRSVYHGSQDGQRIAAGLLRSMTAAGETDPGLYVEAAEVSKSGGKVEALAVAGFVAAVEAMPEVEEKIAIYSKAAHSQNSEALQQAAVSGLLKNAEALPPEKKKERAAAYMTATEHAADYSSSLNTAIAGLLQNADAFAEGSERVNAYGLVCRRSEWRREIQYKAAEGLFAIAGKLSTPEARNEAFTGAALYAEWDSAVRDRACRGLIENAATFTEAVPRVDAYLAAGKHTSYQSETQHLAGVNLLRELEDGAVTNNYRALEYYTDAARYTKKGSETRRLAVAGMLRHIVPEMYEQYPGGAIMEAFRFAPEGSKEQDAAFAGVMQDAAHTSDVGSRANKYQDLARLSAPDSQNRHDALNQLVVLVNSNAEPRHYLYCLEFVIKNATNGGEQQQRAIDRYFAVTDALPEPVSRLRSYRELDRSQIENPVLRETIRDRKYAAISDLPTATQRVEEAQRFRNELIAGESTKIPCPLFQQAGKLLIDNIMQLENPYARVSIAREFIRGHAQSFYKLGSSEHEQEVKLRRDAEKIVKHKGADTALEPRMADRLFSILTVDDVSRMVISVGDALQGALATSPASPVPSTVPSADSVTSSGGVVTAEKTSTSTFRKMLRSTFSSRN